MTINRTGLHRAKGNDWLFHSDDELKGVRRAKYPQLTDGMNPNRRLWWVGDERIQTLLSYRIVSYRMFPAYSVEAQAPGVHGYALILLVTVVGAK